MTQLFGLAVLSVMVAAIVFMVMTMAFSLESKMKSDLGICASINEVSKEGGTGVPSCLEPVIMLGAPSNMGEN